MATMSLALGAGATFYEASRLANYAGGLVVMKRGTATVSADELRQAVRGGRLVMGRIVTESELDTLVAADRAAGRTVAFANGCFDVLHVGHVRYLLGAAAEADRLLVAVNADRAVAGSRGRRVRLLDELARAELVAALRGVDYVVIFPDATVARLLERYRPDVHCKGTDYTVDTVPERCDGSRLRRPHRDCRRPEGPFDDGVAGEDPTRRAVGWLVEAVSSQSRRTMWAQAGQCGAGRTMWGGPLGPPL